MAAMVLVVGCLVVLVGSDGFGFGCQEDFIHLVNFMSHRCVSDVA